MKRELATLFRILTFRATSDELASLNPRHLALGLVLTWLVGMGRWWEDPRANLWQHLGVGSVIYVFVLSLFLWLVLWPMDPRHWSYSNLLTFVSLTSLPGILYAIPVRQGLDVEVGRSIRLGFLAIVAGWRVALLAFYLGRGAGLSGFARFVGTLFPLGIIVAALAALNLERVVFSFMSGIRPEDRSVNDDAYGVLMLITMCSVYLFIPLFLAYAFLSFQGLAARWRRRRGEI